MPGPSEWREPAGVAKLDDLESSRCCPDETDLPRSSLQAAQLLFCELSPKPPERLPGGGGISRAEWNRIGGEYGMAAAEAASMVPTGFTTFTMSPVSHPVCPQMYGVIRIPHTTASEMISEAIETASAWLVRDYSISVTMPVGLLSRESFIEQARAIERKVRRRLRASQALQHRAAVDRIAATLEAVMTR